MRKLILVALTCSVFGGCIGALATAATQSQASPRAIAAAVQRVQDQKADTELASINTKLGTISKTDANLSSISTNLKTISSEFTGDAGQSILDMKQDLFQICENTATGPDVPICSGG